MTHGSRPRACASKSKAHESVTRHYSIVYLAFYSTPKNTHTANGRTRGRVKRLLLQCRYGSQQNAYLLSKHGAGSEERARYRKHHRSLCPSVHHGLSQSLLAPALKGNPCDACVIAFSGTLAPEPVRPENCWPHHHNRATSHAHNYESQLLWGVSGYSGGAIGLEQHHY